MASSSTCQSAYGLIDAPRLWWKRLSKDLAKLGWQKCQTEPCLLHWRNSAGEWKGIAMHHIDDVCFGGDETDAELNSMMEKVRKLYDWGTWESDDFDQTGIHVVQNADFSFNLDQETYATELKPITISHARRADMDSELSDGEKSSLREAVGQLMWTVGQLHFYMLAALSMFQSYGSKPTGVLIQEVIKIIRTVQQYADTRVHIPSLEDPVFVGWTDCAWANRKDLGSQCGYLIAGAERGILKGQASPVGPCPWYSKKCYRVVRSSGGGEIQGASECQEELEYVMV